MKTVLMIPARMGSKRIPKKNIRYLGDKPLIYHVIDTVKSLDIFDDIYINSEDSIFESIAKEKNINFYKRDKKYSKDISTNDEFVSDFLNNIECDYLIQLLPTSPFITKEEIIDFCNTIISKKIDTLISVKDEQIGCVYNNNPINFDKYKPNPPSQDMIPIKVYATSLMGWNVSNYKNNMNTYKSAYHGGEGITEYFTLSGYSTIDIDTEHDWNMAESIYYKINSDNITPIYYGDNLVQTIVPDILKIDGIKDLKFDNHNNMITNIYNIIDTKTKEGLTSWSECIVNSKSNSVTLISQNPGEGNREHFHPDWNEWWYIIDGQWKWTVDKKEHIINKGDLIFIEKDKKHFINAIGSKPALRLAVSKYTVLHVYEN